MRYTDPTGYDTAYFDLGAWLETNGAQLGIGLTVLGVCAVTDGVGCALATIGGTIANAGIARAEGASWGQIGIGIGIGLIAGGIGGSAGESLAAAWGATEGSAAAFAAAAVGGAIGGVIGAELSTAILGGDLGKNVLLGAVEGAAWAAVGWGVQQPTPLAEADQEGVALARRSTIAAIHTGPLTAATRVIQSAVLRRGLRTGPDNLSMSRAD